MKENPKILIVDDDKIVRLILSETLSQGGFTDLLTATNGVEALALIRQHKPDLVITDMMMPVMDGFQMVQEIRNDASLRDVSVIVLTSREEMKELIAMTEVPYFITKPFEKEEALETVRGVLESSISGHRAPSGRGAIERKAMPGDKTECQAGGSGGLAQKTGASLPVSGRDKKKPSDRAPLHEKIRKILEDAG